MDLGFGGFPDYARRQQQAAGLPPVWSDRFEQTLGKGAVPEIIKQYGGEYTLPIADRMWLEEVFRRLAAVTERSEIEYSLVVLNSFEYNAFALPGGYTFITRGLLQLLDMDATKLAAVLGHEIAHVEKKDTALPRCCAKWAWRW